MGYDFPSTPTVGQIANGYVWNGQAWTGNGNLAAVAPPSDGPPANPVNGQLWWESDTGDLFLWFNDGNTSQWVQISGSGIGDAPSDGGFYARQNGVWVTVPRFQRFALAGLGISPDIAVPAGAVRARITGSIMSVSAVSTFPLLQVSVATGVWKTTAGEYTVSGGFHLSNSSPTAWSAIHVNLSFGGMLLTNAHTNQTLPMDFDGVLNLKPAGAAGQISGDFRGAAYVGTGDGAIHSFLRNYVSAITGPVLAFRVVSIANLWATESYLTVEWM